MPTYTTIPESTLTEQLTDTFGGYNHNLKIGDGEFYDMKNLTSDYYPLMGNRGHEVSFRAVCLHTSVEWL